MTEATRELPDSPAGSWTRLYLIERVADRAAQAFLLGLGMLLGLGASACLVIDASEPLARLFWAGIVAVVLTATAKAVEAGFSVWYRYRHERLTKQESGEGSPSTSRPATKST